eukprot:2879035-Rhodomonas_salina.1
MDPKRVEKVRQVHLAHRRRGPHRLDDIDNCRQAKRDLLACTVEPRRSLVDHGLILESGLLQGRRLHHHHDPTLDPGHRVDGDEPLEELVELPSCHHDEVPCPVHDLVGALGVVGNCRVYLEIHAVRPFLNLLPGHSQLLAAPNVDLETPVVARRLHVPQLRQFQALCLLQRLVQLDVHAVEIRELPRDPQMLSCIPVERDHLGRPPSFRPLHKFHNPPRGRLRSRVGCLDPSVSTPPLLTLQQKTSKPCSRGDPFLRGDVHLAEELLVIIVDVGRPPAPVLSETSPGGHPAGKPAARHRLF